MQQDPTHAPDDAERREPAEAGEQASPRGMRRYLEIARLLLRYRKAGIFNGLMLDEAALANSDVAQEQGEPGRPEQFANDLEALGPTFIKLGQALSTRPDLVPAPYLAALERMQDDVATVPFAAIREQIEHELGARLTKVFETFDETPMAAASLAQVHTATLRGGRRVAVKVLRPGIHATIRGDLDVLARLAGTVDKVSDVGRRYHFADWVAEFRKTLLAELDYRVEAENLATFARNLEPYPSLHVPKPIWDLTTTHVLTMELMHGAKVTRVADLRRMEEPLEALGRDLMRAYLDQVFVHGLIHADPHPGNMLLMPGNQLALLDLGMVAHVPPRMRDRLLKLLLAAVDGRGEDTAELFMSIGTRLEDFSEQDFVRDTGRLVAQYCSLSGSDLISEGRMVMELTRVGAAHGLRTAPELTLLAKTLLNLEAVSRALAPEMDVREVIGGHLQSVMRKRMLRSFSPSALASEMLEVQELARDAPRRVSAILHMLAENRLRVHVAGLEESHLLESLQKIANRICAGIVIAALIVGAAMMMSVDTDATLFGYPALALVMFLIAAAFGIVLVISMLMGDRKPRPVEDHGPG